VLKCQRNTHTVHTHYSDKCPCPKITVRTVIRPQMALNVHIPFIFRKHILLKCPRHGHLFECPPEALSTSMYLSGGRMVRWRRQQIELRTSSGGFSEYIISSYTWLGREILSTSSWVHISIMYYVPSWQAVAALHSYACTTQAHRESSHV
jgi:hypothetical protein